MANAINSEDVPGFAEAERRGLVKPQEIHEDESPEGSAEWTGRCPGCGRPFPDWVRVTPVLIEWSEANGAEVTYGDFVWADTTLLVKDRLVDELLEAFPSLDVSEAYLLSGRGDLDPNAQTGPHQILPNNAKPLPYKALNPSRTVDFDRQRTTRVEDVCATCRRTFVHPMGWEEYTPTYDRELQEMITHHIRRTADTGLFVSKTQIGDADWFRINALGGLGNFNYCTDRAMNFITNRGYSNIRFLEVGAVLLD